MNKVRRLTIEKWFWISHLPVTAACFYFVPRVWQAVSVLYLILLSQWTQVRTVDGAIQAAKAAAKGGEHGDEKEHGSQVDDSESRSEQQSHSESCER